MCVGRHFIWRALYLWMEGGLIVATCIYGAHRCCTTWITWAVEATDLKPAEGFTTCAAEAFRFVRTDPGWVYTTYFAAHRRRETRPLARTVGPDGESVHVLDTYVYIYRGSITVHRSFSLYFFLPSFAYGQTLTPTKWAYI